MYGIAVGMSDTESNTRRIGQSPSPPPPTQSEPQQQDTPQLVTPKPEDDVENVGLIRGAPDGEESQHTTAAHVLNNDPERNGGNPQQQDQTEE